MFQEFHFLPIALQKAKRDAVQMMLVYILSLILVFGFLFVTEVKFPEGLNFPHIFLVVIMLSAGIYSIVISKVQVQKIKLLITPDAIRLTKGNMEVKIDFADIVRIQQPRESAIMIFTEASKETPALLLNYLEKQDEFLNFIQPPTPTDNTTKIPFRLTQVYRLAVNFVFLTLVLIQAVFHLPSMIFASGILFLVLLGYFAISSYRYRKQVSNPLMNILFLVMGLAMLYRVGILAYYLVLHLNN